MVKQLILCCACVALLVSAGCDAHDTAQAQTASLTRTQNLQRTDLSGLRMDTTLAAQLSATFRAAALRALPAVLEVRVTARFSMQTRRRGDIPFQLPDSGRAISGASGFIFDARGYAITNNHVVENAERIGVVLADGRDFEAEVVGSDPNSDVAVIRLRAPEGTAFPVLEVGNADELNVGDWVIALGNPLGYEFTVTAGVVSAKGRSTGILQNNDNMQIEAFIQTDAAINPGNSGGPLIDLRGRVVGVNTAIESPTGYFAGAGFAIPIELAGKVADDLVRFGAVHRPRIGVALQDVTAADAEVYKLKQIGGAEIISVTPGLPGEKAGLMMGDVVVAVNGTAVRSVTDLQYRVARFQPGQDVRLSLYRCGNAAQAGPGTACTSTLMERTVRLGEFNGTERSATPRPAAASGTGLLGFTMMPLPDDVRAQFGFGPGEGVLIDAIDPFGPLIEQRLRVPRNYVILRINGQPIRRIEDVNRLASSFRSGEVISMVVQGLRGDRDAAIFNYRLR
jgi:serine protease Do